MLGPLEMESAVAASRVTVGGRVFEFAPETIEAMLGNSSDDCPKCGKRSMPPWVSKPGNKPIMRLCCLCGYVDVWPEFLEASC